MQFIASQTSEDKFKPSLCLPVCLGLSTYLGGGIATVAQKGSNEVIRLTNCTVCKALK